MATHTDPVCGMKIDDQKNHVTSYLPGEYLLHLLRGLQNEV